MGPRSHERGNFPSGRQERRRRFRFNGAAFSRTRKPLDKVDKLHDRYVALQWGRVLTNAETCRISKTRSERTCFNGAAFSRTRKPSETPGMKAPTMGFNGAAFSRTRKLRLSRPARRSSRWLQWGRVLTNAETGGNLRPAGRPEPASMGPRSHERGNSANSKS